jgi:hypothetical protein
MANRTEEVAAEILSGASGAPSGAPVYATPEEPRKKRKYTRRVQEPVQEEPGYFARALTFHYQADDTSIAASTVLGAMVWSIIAPMLKVRDLTKEEREMLGRALDPVLCRWVPIMADWKFEAALIMTIFSLAQTARKDWVESHGLDGKGNAGSSPGA